MLNKLRKAEQYALELSTLCEQVPVDARTKLEVQVRVFLRRAFWDTQYLCSIYR